MARALRVTAAMCIAIFAAGSCAQAATKVNLWHPWSGQMGKSFSELVVRFNREHKEIRVVPQTVDVTQIDQKVLLAVASGSGPDVAWGFPALIGRSGSFIADLTPFIQMEKGAMADVLPKYWESAKYKGQVLGFPIEANGTAVAYNVDLLAAAGVKPPADSWDWDQFVDVAKRLTLDKNGDGKPDQWGWSGSLDFGDPWGFLPYLWQAGGDLFDDGYSPKKVLVNSKEAVEALRYMTNLGNKWGITVPGLSSGSLSSKKVAMQTDGAWSMGEWAKVKGLKVDAAVLPRYRNEANILLIAHLYLLKKNSRQQQASWEFVKWFCSPSNNAWWALSTGYLPIRRKAMSSPEYTAFVKEMPAARAYLSGMDTARPRPFWLPAWKRFGASLGGNIQKSLAQKLSPEQALQATSDEFGKILATMRK